MIGVSSLLQNTILNKIQEEYVGMIVTSGDLLLRVVNDVLDYSKLEAGRVVVDIQKCSLQTTLNAVVRSIETNASSKNLVVQSHYDPKISESIYTDSRRLQQILYNLLGSKFSSFYWGNWHMYSTYEHY